MSEVKARISFFVRPIEGWIFIGIRNESIYMHELKLFVLSSTSHLWLLPRAWNIYDIATQVWRFHYLLLHNVDKTSRQWNRIISLKAFSGPVMIILSFLSRRASEICAAMQYIALKPAPHRPRLFSSPRESRGESSSQNWTWSTLKWEWKAKLTWPRDGGTRG